MTQLRTTAMLTAAAMIVLTVSACGGSSSPAPAATVTSSAPSAGSSSSPAASATATASPSVTAQPTGLPAGYLPLFPFAALADVRAWQASYEAGGHQPWHLSPGVTATAFAAYLGYAGVSQVAGTTVKGGDAHVAIGIKLPNGTTSTAAIVHLVLFGSGRDAPWEVVGTDDRTFTVDRPAYGSTARSPVTAGGTITGVDENIRLSVHALPAETAVGAYCCRAAGGTRSAWSASVSFSVGRGQVITIAAATGGHVASVERFAVTGARAG